MVSKSAVLIRLALIFLVSVACKSFVECLLNLLPDVYLIEAAIDLLENPDEQV